MIRYEAGSKWSEARRQRWQTDFVKVFKWKHSLGISKAFSVCNNFVSLQKKKKKKTFKKFLLDIRQSNSFFLPGNLFFCEFVSVSETTSVRYRNCLSSPVYKIIHNNTASSAVKKKSGNEFCRS